MKSVSKRLSVFVFVCLAPAMAQAQSSEIFRQQSQDMARDEFENVHGMALGPEASLKAAVSQQEVSDSNIFLTANNQKQDYLSITSPRLLLTAPAAGMDSGHMFQLMYGADIGSYSDFKDQNYVDQTARAKADFTLPFGYFNLQNEFHDTVDRAATEFTRQVRRHEDLTQAAFGVQMNKLSYEAGYARFLRGYHDPGLRELNYNEDFYSATAYYQAFVRTQALLEYDHGVIDYTKDASRNGDYDQVRAGFKRDLTGKTSGLIKLGYQKRDYDTHTHSGFEGFVSTAELDTAFSERTLLKLGCLSTAVESVDANNNYYDVNQIGLDLTQDLSGHFSLTASSRLEVRSYPDEDPAAGKKRRDSVATEGLTLSYHIKEWGKVDLGYQYLDDIANIDGNGYRDHQISLRFDFMI